MARKGPVEIPKLLKVGVRAENTEKVNKMYFTKLKTCVTFERSHSRKEFV